MVDLEAAANDPLVGVIWTTLLICTLLHSLNQCILVIADEMDDTQHLDVLLENLDLLDTAWNAIEQQQIGIRLVLIGVDETLDVLLPEEAGQFVWNEKTLSRVLEKFLTKSGLAIEPAEHVASGKMNEAGHGYEDLALGSLADTWLAKENTVLSLSDKVLGPCWGWMSRNRIRG